VRTAGAIPGQTGLCVDGTVDLRGDEVEPTDVRFGDEDPASEARWLEPIRIDVDEHLAAALPVADRLMS